MPVRNEQIAAVFEEIADLLALQGQNPFRIRAYQRAAQFIRGQRRELSDRVRAGEALDDLPAIGPDLRDRILEILATGSSAALVRLRQQVPAGLAELLRLPGLGPKRVRSLSAILKIRTRRDLDRALAQGKLSRVPGFGPKLVSRLALELRKPQVRHDRWLRSTVGGIAEPLAAYLRQIPGVVNVTIAGSYRRGRDTVGDLDLVVAASQGAAVLEALRAYEDVRQWSAAGRKRMAFVLQGGLRVDVRVCTPETAGAMLHYLTGSRSHVVRLRRLAQERGLRINEYGVHRGQTLLAGATETAVYRALGLPLIPPELREDRGELEAATAGHLPRLVTRLDLRGDLHVHTSDTDGQDTLRAMVLAARSAGLSYVAITDHSRHLGVVNGLDARRLRRQMERIDRLNDELTGIRILKGVEVDILEDGSLALPDGLLRELDLVVGAVHGHLDLSEQRQTRRLLRAMDHPAFSILAHPTARLIGDRTPIAFDLQRICSAAKARPCYLELNAQPQRLDLDDVHCRAAREQGVLISIASDAHATAQFDYLELGVLQARRGWLTRDSVLNARPLPQLRKLLAATIH